MGEVYGRAMPAAPLATERWIADAQLYARHASVADEAGEAYEARTWSEIDVVQWIASAAGRARVVHRRARTRWASRPRTGPSPSRSPAPRRPAPTVRRGGDGSATVHVAAAVTTTLGGLATDARGRVAGACGRPAPTRAGWPRAATAAGWPARW